jgi:hypothetical protein
VLTVLLLGFAGTLKAGEVIDYLRIDGKTYQTVKWGPVNQGKVVIFHSHGVTMIPLEKLPEEYQAQFGYQPPPTPPPTPRRVEPPEQTTLPSQVVPPPQKPPTVSVPVTPTPANNTQSNAEQARAQLEKMRPVSQQLSPLDAADWKKYNSERGSKLFLKGRLVDRSTLTVLTGFLQRSVITSDDGEAPQQTWMLNLANRKPDAAHVSSAMELRPSLWKPTGEDVVLLGHPQNDEAGRLVRIYCIETDRIADHRAFIVATDPTFEQWQKLHNQ